MSQNDTVSFSVRHIRRYMMLLCPHINFEHLVFGNYMRVPGALFLFFAIVPYVWIFFFFLTESSNMIVKKDLDCESWLDISFVKAVIFKTFFF